MSIQKSLKDKYNKKPQHSPKKKGNMDVIGRLVEDDNTRADIDSHKAPIEKRDIKKATFELDAKLHKRLRTFAAINDTTMIDIVEKAITEFLENHPN